MKIDAFKYYIKMAGIGSEIDESGLIKNTIKNGLGMSFLSIISEKLDNSLDANSKNITITIDNIETKISNRGRIENIKSCALIISDDGCGMKEEDNSLQGLLSLFKMNENSDKNGIYGIGSIASDLALGDNYTIYFTRSKDINQDYEIVIPWNKIFSDKSKTVWSNKVSVNNISDINKKLLKKYQLNKKSGTTVINFFDDEYFLDYINIYELNYYIKKNYFSYLKSGVIININVLKSLMNFNSENLESYSSSEEYIEEYSDEDNQNLQNDFVENGKYISFICNKEKSIDVLSIDLIKKNGNLGCLVFADITTYYHNIKKAYGFKFSIKDYKLGKTKINKKISKFLFPFNKHQNPRNLSLEEDLDGWEVIGTYKIDISLVTNEIVKKDEKLMKDALGRSDVSSYTGLYLKRNNRILCEPTNLYKLRNTQTGSNWRAILSWNSNKKLDALIKPQLNKSKVNKDNFNKTLYRGISLFVKDFYDRSSNSFYKKVICPKKGIPKISCEMWKYDWIKRISDEPVVPSPKPTPKPSPKPKPDPTPIVRKNFTQKQEIEALKKQRSRCNILDIPIDNLYMPYDRDHIDSDSSNVSDDNLQLLTLIAHRHKTNLDQNGKKEYNNMIDQKGIFITEMINALSSSKYFKKLFDSGKIRIRSGRLGDDGLFEIKNEKKLFDI